MWCHGAMKVPRMAWLGALLAAAPLGWGQQVGDDHAEETSTAGPTAKGPTSKSAADASPAEGKNRRRRKKKRESRQADRPKAS